MLGDSSRKAIVFGVDDLFGEEIACGLAAENNDIILCGDRNERQSSVQSRFPERIKGLCARDSSLDKSEYQKRVQVMIESHGSLDALIYLLGTGPDGQDTDKGTEDRESVFQSNLVDPINMVRAVLPYLNKSTGSKIIFVDTAAFTPGAILTPMNYCSQMVLTEFCHAVTEEMAGKPVEARTLFSPDQLMPMDTSSTKDASPTARQAGMACYAELAEKIQEVLNPARQPVAVLQETPVLSAT